MGFEKEDLNKEKHFRVHKKEGDNLPRKEAYSRRPKKRRKIFKKSSLKKLFGG